MKPLSLQFWESFTTPDGVVRALKAPSASATPRQLRRLNEAGMLVVVGLGQARPIKKGEAAFAVSLLPVGKPTEGEQSKAWGFR